VSLQIDEAATANQSAQSEPARRKSMLLVYVLLAVLAIAGVLAAVVASRPSEFTLSRKATINASPSSVFEHVNDFHKWGGWSPWEKLDPNLKRTYEGPDSGVGARYSWAGNNQVGEGRMTIVESVPAEKIVIDLEFLKPFAARNTTEFLFTPDGSGTTVTWTMTGKNNFMAKAMGLLMDMDKMIGGQFEQGLSQMKAVSEGTAE